ncbi:MAG: glycosyltransferase family 4 protein [Eubacterium sp.]|nr:glycosyltransferase family 4 protein [Eubacterium sp.]
MSKKKVCFIAQFPPPIHGLSKAVETLYNSDLKNVFEFEKVDITNNKDFIKNIIKIGRSKADLFYFTISQTKGGNIRDLIILKILSMQGKKCLIHLHGGYYRQLVDKELSFLQRKMNFNAIKKLVGVIVLGESLKYIFKGMISQDKIFVVPNCVDDEFLISNEEFDLKINKQDEVKHILYLSNFIKEKGYRYVLKLANYEKNLCSNGKKNTIHFDFAGKFFDDEEKEYFYSYIKDNGLEKYITYHGVVSGNEKRELLKVCDGFVLLTRYPKEGQPISILEAMGNGMVIITTDHAGIPDIATNENGIVFENGSEENIDIAYNRIIDLFNSDFKSIATRNRNIILNNYKESMYIYNLKNLFKRI